MGVSYDKGFSYTACLGCKKKVQGDRCEKCGEGKGTKETYTFSIQVSDGTDAIWVHIFGEEGEKLLGKLAGELKEDREDGGSLYKQVFEGIKGQV